MNGVDSAVLVEFARLSIRELTHHDRASKLYCDLCSRTRPASRHADWCPILDVENLLRRLERDRRKAMPLPLEGFSPPPPIASDASPSLHGKGPTRPSS